MIDDKALDYAIGKVVHALSGYSAEVVSLDETQKPYDSSPGFPYLMEYLTEAEMIHGERNSSMYQQVWEKLAEDKITTFTYYCFLKAEMLKPEKNRDSNIRGIYCMPAPFARAQARLDEHLNKYIMGDAPKNGICVGLSGTGHGPQAMARYLGLANYYVEGDFKRFDGTIPAWVLLLIRFLRYQCYGLKDRRLFNRCKSMAYNLVWKELLMPNGLVARVDKGNPSGQMSTSIDNCLVNLFVTSYTHFVVYGSKSRVFRYLFYGDDRVVAMNIVPDPVAEDVVLRTTFGMTIPPETVVVKRELEGISFCGFRFAKINGRWRGRYITDRILSNLLTPVHRTPSFQHYYLRLLCACILVVWEPKLFDHLYRLLRRVKEKVELWLPPRTWFFWVNGGGWAKNDLSKVQLYATGDD